MQSVARVTRSSADADKPARRIYRSVKVTKHSTIPYVRYFSSCAIVTLSLFDFTKCCDLEIRVRDHSRSLKVVPKIAYGFLLVFCRNIVPKMHRF